MTNSARRIQDILPAYAWLKERGHYCILSPDCDGFLCGLFMSHFLDWKIKGYYDGKILAVEKGIRPEQCVFLDMEICRPNVRSIGQHMLYYNILRPPHEEISANFRNCLSPNNIRGFDFNTKFMRKYPLGTVHLLMALLPHNQNAAREGNFAPLFYVDGTFKNLLNYPENCLEWLRFLDAENNALAELFYGDYPFSKLMSAMCDFFALLKNMSGDGGKPDKLHLSTGKNIINGAIEQNQKLQTENFLKTMGHMTGWKYQPEKWAWKNYETHLFEKGGVQPGLARFQELMAKRPLSWAIISRNSIEFTLDTNGVFRG